MTFLKSIVGSFSTGAAANPTVALMEAAFEDLNLPWTYLNCEVEAGGLEAAVIGAVSMGWRGFNCSMPHKQTVIPLIDRLSETAAITNAVNCVVVGDASELVGHNTDGTGFLHSVSEVTDVPGCAAVVIGSGGAAHAIAVELARAGASTVTIASRNSTSRSSLTGLIRSQTTTETHAVGLDRPVDIGNTDLVVNATPVGSAHTGDPGQSAVYLGNAAELIDWESADRQLTVADVTINPAQTSLLRAAEDAGHTTVDGTGMLVNQAIENVRLWTHERASKRPMRRALETAFGL